MGRGRERVASAGCCIDARAYSIPQGPVDREILQPRPDPAQVLRQPDEALLVKLESDREKRPRRTSLRVAETGGREPRQVVPGHHPEILRQPVSSFDTVT